ncbi:MAG: transcription elongation factor GreA [Patescibacteria group bacterium]|nr:transcription elongation factor GreA [Patescibacteria group bacterium]
MSKQIPFTKEGYDNLKKEYQSLMESRPSAVEELKKAREMGDLSENGYYKAAKFKLSSIDYNLRRIDRILKNAVVIENIKKDIIDIGSRIILKTDNKTVEYNIVGGYESNPSAGKISHLSPLGKALIGKRVNEEIQIETPSGKVSYKIAKVE